jgi:hypothetical protein
MGSERSRATAGTGELPELRAMLRKHADGPLDPPGRADLLANLARRDPQALAIVDKAVMALLDGGRQ